jgi:hypothetical protein
MLNSDEMAELLIAAHGLDVALNEACEMIVTLRSTGDAVGVQMWSRVASTICDIGLARSG